MLKTPKNIKSRLDSSTPSKILMPMMLKMGTKHFVAFSATQEQIWRNNNADHRTNFADDVRTRLYRHSDL